MKTKMLKLIILLLVVLTIPFTSRAETQLPKAGITPDSFFYFIDATTEKIGMFFAFGAEAKAEKSLEYSNEKIAEMKIMAEKNDLNGLEKAAAAFKNYSQVATDSVNKLSDSKKTEIKKEVSAKILLQQDFLIGISDNLDESTRPKIEEVISRGDAANAEIPNDLLGLWKYSGMYQYKNKNWERLTLARIPLYLYQKKIKPEGVCVLGGYPYRVDGNERGMVCESYKPLGIIGHTISFPADEPFVENYAGFKFDKEVGEAPWPTPIRWNVDQSGNLELISLSLSKEPLFKYVFQKDNHPAYSPVGIELKAESPVVKAGQDMKIQGFAKTDETIRIYMKTEGMTHPDDFMPFEMCDSDFCSSKPIIDIGTMVPPPPDPKQQKKTWVDFEHEEYFDCPFHPMRWEFTEGKHQGELVTWMTICLKPNEEGEFSLRIFNNGISEKQSRKITVFAKLASQDIVASTQVDFLNCATAGLKCGYMQPLKRETCGDECAERSYEIKPPEPEPVFTETKPENWKTFKNEKWHFSFSYPETFSNKEKYEGMFSVNAKNTQYTKASGASLLKKGAEITVLGAQTYLDKPSAEKWYPFKKNQVQKTISEYAYYDYPGKITESNGKSRIQYEMLGKNGSGPCLIKRAVFYDEKTITEVTLEMEACGEIDKYRPIFDKVASQFKFID